MYRILRAVACFCLATGGLGAANEMSCDPTVPEYCMLPFPNDFWRIRTDSGFRLNIQKDTFPADDSGKLIDPTNWNVASGFSVFPAITAYFPGMDDRCLQGLPRWWSISSSLEERAPIVLLDTVTGERVSYWTELDHSSNSSEMSGKHALLIWPATALQFGRRYVVAIRSLARPEGGSYQPSAAFAALRAGTAPQRQEHYDDIFEHLRSLGIARESLLLAWDFTTNDKADVTGRLVSARDDALQRVGVDGPRYRIASVEASPDALVAKRIKGKFEMPLYLNTHKPEKHARLVLDEHMRPVFQGYAWFDFEVVVPSAFADTPRSAGVLQYGHGLFGSYEEVEYSSSSYLYEDATNYGYVLAASTWLGLSGQDVPAVASILVTDLSDIQYIPDRNTQGVVNALGLMRMMKGAFARDPEMLTATGEPILDTDKTAYYGNSCGGIMGTVYMALTQDVSRGLLGVGGGPFGLTLPRSKDYAVEFAVLKARYSDPVDAIMLEQIMQMVWDRSEPSGYMSSVTTDPLPNTLSHQVLLHYGLADVQVSSLSAHALSRSTDAVMYASNAKEHDEVFYGFELLDDDAVVSGRSGIQGFDYKSAQIPEENKPPATEGDTHEMPRRDPHAQEQMGHFFLTGEIVNTCGGPCISDPIDY